jgi:ssDNA-binding Zn-finger/Zn-ribbon topoisomerase 1
MYHQTDPKSLKERLHQLEVDSILKEGIYDDLLHNRMELAEGKGCPLCMKREDGKGVGAMQKRVGPYGAFLSCSRYPVCKFSWNTPAIRSNKENDPLAEVIV